MELAINIEDLLNKQKIESNRIEFKRELAILQGKGFLTRKGGRKEGKWVIKV